MMTQDSHNLNGSLNKLLILGAGNFQLDAIRYCKDRGLKVFGCSNRSTDPGIPLLDGFSTIDIRDIAGVEKYAKDSEVDAVYSIGSDIAIPTVMKASEDLDLPHFISYETACTCQDKSRMRSTFADTPWSVPFVSTDSAEEAMAFELFPAMMKPLDSQGQRGCFRVESSRDIERYFSSSAQHSSNGYVIVERYIDGPEISVNAFRRNGETVFLMPSDRYSYVEHPGGIIKEHGLPCASLTDAGRAKVETLVEQALSTLGIDNGPAYFQIKMQGDDPYIIEIAPRLDGCHMWHFIEQYCGFDLLEATFDLLLDKTFDQPSPHPVEGDWRLSFMNLPPGTILDRSSFDTHGSTYTEWYYESGTVVPSLNGIMEKCGYRIHRIDAS